MKAESTFSLKDHLFNPEKVAYLAGLFTNTYSAFEADAFCEEVIEAFPQLELKQRITHIAETLHRFLPSEYEVALKIILDALPPELDPTRTDDDFGDFIIAPLSHFVALYGCTAVSLHASLHALCQITKRFSAEDAIRTFINAFPDETLDFLLDCAQDDNYHVRRLASEGTRPKLPWSQKLTIPHTAPLPILDALYADPTRYVTRSVANHLNDISKIEPELVVKRLAQWQERGQQEPDEMEFIIKHSLRTLIKNGDLDALRLLGYGAEPEIEVCNFVTSTPDVVVGEAFLFSLEIVSHKRQKLLVDYVMTFATDRKQGSQKVFKLKQVAAEAGERVQIRKKHPMRMMTTRRLMAGKHTVMLQVNGRPFGTLSFNLQEP